MAVPQHQLGEEIVLDMERDGRTGRVYRGRDADDPEAPGEKMCREHERAAAIFKALGSVERNACRSKGGKSQCEFFDVCGYRKQRQATPQTWIVPHASLFHRRPRFIPQPAALVIDEAFYNAGLNGTDKPIWLDVSALLGHRTVPKKAGDTDLYATADLSQVSARAHKAITGQKYGETSTDAGADGWVRLDALIRAGLNADDLRNAQKLEWRRKLELADVLPGMPRGDALRLCKSVAAHNQRVRLLARLFDLLARQIEGGHARSPWLYFQHDAPLRDDIGPGVRMAWRSDINKSWLAPTLLLDATLQPDIARAFFPQMAEQARIDAPMPHTRVRQITDQPLSHAHFIPTKGAGERRNASRRNNLEKLRRVIEVRAADVAPGRGVVICQQDVEKALKAGPLPGEHRGGSLQRHQRS